MEVKGQEETQDKKEEGQNDVPQTKTDQDYIPIRESYFFCKKEKCKGTAFATEASLSKHQQEESESAEDVTKPEAGQEISVDNQGLESSAEENTRKTNQDKDRKHAVTDVRVTSGTSGQEKLRKAMTTTKSHSPRKIWYEYVPMLISNELGDSNKSDHANY